MPLPKPTLDNRRFDQLVSEGRALIPRLAPEWTDHNTSDPGITLLELGAWLAEQNIYRFDRVSEEAQRAFVRLIGIEPRMPTVARTVVAIANDNTGLALPARVQLGDATVALFETTDPLYASPAKLVKVLVGADTLLDVTDRNDALEAFDAFGSRPRTGHCFYLGFDRALDAPGATLSLYAWTDHWHEDAQTRAALLAEVKGARSDVHCPETLDWRKHYRVSTVWEFYAGANTWLPLREVEDETRALTLSGFVRFAAPNGHQSGGAGTEFFVRCRILDDRFECPPRLEHVGFNAVAAEHALSCAERSVGVARGHALTTFALGLAPVVAGSVSLRVDNGAGDVQSDWKEAPDFERAGAHDRVFVLDPEHAELRSGDGLRAQVIPAGYELFAAFRAGGGERGNLDALTLTNVPSTAANLALCPALATLAIPLGVAQPFAADGGAPRETLASAQARAFEEIESVDKAVTLEDFERLALATPGVPIARVRAIANTEPHLPCYPAPGVITLVVIPHCPKPAPLPSRALLDAVERYLEPRRLVTSEVHAIAPHYRRVSVDATLQLDCDTEANSVLAAASTRIDQFFDPLEGGPDRTGWPFGRTVYRTEVMALLADVPGVARVTSLTLQAICSGDCSGARCDNIELCSHELVIPGRHQLLAQSEIARSLKRSDAYECGSA